jgi:hypothetical protein
MYYKKIVKEREHETSKNKMMYPGTGRNNEVMKELALI